MWVELSRLQKGLARWWVWQKLRERGQAIDFQRELSTMIPVSRPLSRDRLLQNGLLEQEIQLARAKTEEEEVDAAVFLRLLVENLLLKRKTMATRIRLVRLER